MGDEVEGLLSEMSEVERLANYVLFRERLEQDGWEQDRYVPHCMTLFQAGENLTMCMHCLSYSAGGGRLRKAFALQHMSCYDESSEIRRKILNEVKSGAHSGWLEDYKQLRQGMVSSFTGRR